MRSQLASLIPSKGNLVSSRQPHARDTASSEIFRNIASPGLWDPFYFRHVPNGTLWQDLDDRETEKSPNYAWRQPISSRYLRRAEDNASVSNSIGNVDIKSIDTYSTLGERNGVSLVIRSTFFRLMISMLLFRLSRTPDKYKRSGETSGEYRKFLDPIEANASPATDRKSVKRN